ncbi:MAG: hypothetical protein ACR2P6_07815 [Gammaproteobacteria bacterium]
MSTWKAITHSKLALAALAFGLAPAVGKSVEEAAARYQVEMLLPKAPLHGANGMELDADGQLIVGSMMSATIVSINPDDFSVSLLVDAPRGIADDLAIGPDGTLVWTSTPFGIIHARRPGGEIETLAKNLPMINSINFSADGRLFAAQVTETTGNLYEIDLDGKRAPLVVVADLPGLNGFEIDAENILYGPLQWDHKVIRVDLNDASTSVLAEGFTRPVAVNLDSQGFVIALDYLDGDVFRIDPSSGDKELLVSLEPPVDNLAIDADDRIYVSHPCTNGVERIDPRTGEVEPIAVGSIGMPGGAQIVVRDGREQLLVAGLFCQHYIDLQNGTLERTRRRGDTIWAGWIDTRDGTTVLSGFAFGELQWLNSKTGEPRTTRRDFASPYAIELLDDGSVLVAEHGKNRIIRVAEDLNSEPSTVADKLDGPVDFIRTEKGMYVSEAGAGLLSFVDKASGAKTIIADGLKLPEGIALMPDQRVLIVEAGAKRLIAINPFDGSRELIAADLPIGLPPFMGTAKTFLPSGVRIATDGSIYVVADAAANVLKISSIAK